jgi:hypothetical protein
LRVPVENLSAEFVSAERFLRNEYRPPLLHSGTGHVSAFFRTLTARFGAMSTMVGFVLSAFRTASVTDIGAHSADVMSEL